MHADFSDFCSTKNTKSSLVTEQKLRRGYGIDDFSESTEK